MAPLDFYSMWKDKNTPILKKKKKKPMMDSREEFLYVITNYHLAQNAKE